MSKSPPFMLHDYQHVHTARACFTTRPPLYRLVESANTPSNSNLPDPVSCTAF